MYFTIVRIYVLKMANLLTVAISLYIKYMEGSCPETLIGQEFWMLLVIDFVRSAKNFVWLCDVPPPESPEPLIMQGMSATGGFECERHGVGDC